MEVQPVNALPPVRAARALMLLVAVALGEGCVMLDDAAVGTAADGGVAIDRRDGGDARDAGDLGDSSLGHLDPDAAPPATAGDGGFADRAGVADAIGAEAGTSPEATPVDVAPPPEAAPPADVPVPLPSPPDAAPSPPDVPPAGTPTLVVHWPFNEGRGLTISDATGKGSNGVLRNGAGWGAGVEGTAIDLDGEDDFAQGTPVTAPLIEAPKSITFFYFRPGDMGTGPGGGNVANGKRACVSLSAPASRAGLQIGTDRGRPAIWQWGQTQGFAASSKPAPAGWSHLAYTYDGTRHRLYVDGVLADSSVQAPQQGRPTQLLVGAQSAAELTDHETCHGRVDELRIYDRALSETELAQLAKH